MVEFLRQRDLGRHGRFQQGMRRGRYVFAARGENPNNTCGVVGCGRMGGCTRGLRADAGTKLVGVYDAVPKAAETVAAEFGTKVVAILDELAEQVAAVTIAVPTEHHAKAAEPFLKRGIACLIEKPLARNSAEGADRRPGARHGACSRWVTSSDSILRWWRFPN